MGDSPCQNVVSPPLKREVPGNDDLTVEYVVLPHLSQKGRTSCGRYTRRAQRFLPDWTVVPAEKSAGSTL